jgi:DNA-binding MarR family transcriptional regulator
MTSRDDSPAASAPAATQLSLVDGLAQLSFTVRGLLERRAAEHDLSMVQIRLLGVLRDRHPTMNELAGLLQLDKSSTTGLVTRAERRGLVTRVPSTSDRRSVSVALTDAGRDLIETAAGRFGTDVADLLSGLSTDDRATFVALVSQILVARADIQGINLFPDTTSLP